VTEQSFRVPGIGVDPGAGAGQPLAEVDLADAVTSAVLDVDGVASMHGGIFGEAATYLPGRRVLGVRIRPTGTEVNVVAEPGYPLPALADRIRAAVLGVPGAVAPVDVHIDGIEDHPVPDQRRPDDPPTTRRSPAGDRPGTSPPEEATP